MKYISNLTALNNVTYFAYDPIDCNALFTSNYVFKQARKVNIFCSVLITVLGLIGNVLTMAVYTSKRFRINSSCVYLLCMAISDGLFLVVHFFEGFYLFFK